MCSKLLFPFFPIILVLFSCQNNNFPPIPTFNEVSKEKANRCEFEYRDIAVNFRSQKEVNGNPFSLIERLYDLDILNLDDSLLMATIVSYRGGDKRYTQYSGFELAGTYVTDRHEKDSCYTFGQNCEIIELTNAQHTHEIFKISHYDLLTSKGLFISVWNQVDKRFLDDPVFFDNPFNWTVEIDDDLSTTDIFILPNGKVIRVDNQCNC